MRFPGNRLQFLLLISILALLPRVYVAAIHPITYDEYWHLLVARQETAAGFAREWRTTAHPPLYYWLLASVTSVASGRLLERSISILAGVAVVFAAGQVAMQLTSSPAISLLTALAFALSPSAIVISSEIRSYMLCTLFILVAFSRLLALVRGDRSIGTLTGFAMASWLALVSHYVTTFFLLACFGVLTYVTVLRLVSRGSLRQALRELWVPGAVAMLPIAVTTAYLYRTHIRGWLGPHYHLTTFYYHPESGEGLRSYLLDAAHDAFNLFLPVSLGEWARIPVAVLWVGLLAAAIMYLCRMPRRASDMPRALPLLIFLCILAELLVASIRGLYPFGGDLRHQFVLFPFLLLSVCVLIDAAVSYRPDLASPILALALLAIGLNCAVGLRRADVAMEEGIAERYVEDVAFYRRTFPLPEAVYLDQYSVMVFFAYHDRWRWRPLDVSRYELTSEGNRMVALRDRGRWNVNVLDERFYGDLVRRLEQAGVRSTTLFALRHSALVGPYLPGEHEAIARSVRELAARQGLRTRGLVIHDFALFAEFSVRGPSVSDDRD